jgi:hypothetical protein
MLKVFTLMDVLKVIKEEGNIIKPYEGKTAVLGLNGLIKAGYNFVVGLANPNYKLFDSEQAAKD